MKQKSKICVITLTYNRPEYIERSFESLYKRAGAKFDHYVFDDYSDKETIKKLKTLQRKYKFKLLESDKKNGIYKCFYYNLKYIPMGYEYYIKFDSDVEVLSDNLLPQLEECFKLSSNVGGLTPRVEGVQNSDRYDSRIEFFSGHAIKIGAPIVYGCCLVMRKEVFNTFPRLTDEQIDKISEKWGIDSKLYSHAKEFGKFLIVEDLSVYHIDNTYGQRRINPNYFTNRSRWYIIDNERVSYMQISGIISPAFIKFEDFVNLKKISSTYDEFVTNCKNFVKDYKNFDIQRVLDEKREEIQKQTQKVDEEIKKEEQIMRIKKMYKIISPENFPSDPRMKHGSFKLFTTVPDWAKNNPKFVIEVEEIEEIIMKDKPVTKKTETKKSKSKKSKKKSVPKKKKPAPKKKKSK